MRRETRNEKMRRVKEELANLQDGEFITPTPFAREKVGISQPTLIEILDEIVTWADFFKQNPNLLFAKDNNGKYITIGKEKEVFEKDQLIKKFSKLLDKKLKHLKK